MIDDIAPTATADKLSEPSTKDDEGLFLTLKEQILADIEASSAWRTRARNNFAFLAGIGDKQWDEEALKILRDEKRPVITFNRLLKYVMAIRGLEINNRHETVFLPRQVSNPGKVEANEVLSQCSEWMDQQCNAPRHKSRAFRDMLATGLGATESCMDYDEDPRGKYVRTRGNPIEFGWDHNATDQNYLDSKRRWRIRKMLISEARSLLPGITDSPDVMDSDLDASWAAGVDVDSKDEAGNTKSKEQREKREESTGIADPKKKVHIVQAQWWEYEAYHKVNIPDLQSPGGTKNIDVPPEKLGQLQAKADENGIPIKASRVLRRKVYKQAFIGSRVLDSGPAPKPDGFTFNFMTYEIDDSDGMPFGFVDIMRDVQIWSNKLFSQVLHIINTTAKGGILAEATAFEDIKEAQKTYARPDAITEVSDGALTKGKIIAKPGAGMPAGIIAMLKFAIEAYSDVSGVNLEIMGLADREQPGVLEAQRKQAAMTILATAFDSVSLYEQEEGKTKLYFIQTFIATSPRMIRIAGDDGFEVIPLLADKTLGEYDIVVEDAPTSPNTKERAWQALQMLVPTLQKENLLTPEVVSAMLDYVPFLPSKLVQVLKKIATRPDPDAQMRREAAITSALEDLRGKKAVREKDQAMADNLRASAVVNMAKAGATQAQVELDHWNALIEAAGLKTAAEAASDDAGSQPQQGALPSLPSLGSQPMTQQPQPEMPPQMPQGGMPQMPGGIVPPGGLQ